MQGQRTNPRPRMRTIIKWAAITLAGIFLFLWGKGAAQAQRGYIAAGGEYLLLLFPLLWWITEKTWKDFCRAQHPAPKKDDEALKTDDCRVALEAAGHAAQDAGQTSFED